MYAKHLHCSTTSMKLLTNQIPARTGCENTLTNMLDSYRSISCLNHERKIQLFVNRVISNTFLNNKRKLSTDSVSVDTIKSLNKKQKKNREK